MTRTIGILIFDDAEELDFVGPWEVFTMSNEMFALQGKERPDNVILISPDGNTITCAKGMRIEADYSMENAPKLDVILMPGGNGTRALEKDKTFLTNLKKLAKPCEWVTSVCTGSLVLAAAGLTEGKRITTHWAFVEELRQRPYKKGEVLSNARYVRDGNLVTAAGVSAGIDMALWLNGQLHGPDHARFTQKGMEYDPAPPYAAFT
ncbi:DJ-1/PfpI family protein [Tepidicaulis sp. LMO-SS28]|uniref:DJ-1/PfpI family protein n=1 Tax=Tepidicaulis sp. LMO-SS28 TaxID=3447455 RepID=UPI003EE3C47E